MAEQVALVPVSWLVHDQVRLPPELLRLVTVPAEHRFVVGGVLKEAPYGFKSRFEGGKGTNPEELIGEAHAGCFSMALSLMLGQAGLVPEKIETHAEVTLDKVGEGFEITASHLSVVASIPGADAARF